MNEQLQVIEGSCHSNLKWDGWVWTVCVVLVCMCALCMCVLIVCVVCLSVCMCVISHAYSRYRPHYTLPQVDMKKRCGKF